MWTSVKFLLFVGGLGGLPCGIDFGIIAVSMPYIRALGLYNDLQIGWIVGGVMLGGSVRDCPSGRKAVLWLQSRCRAYSWDGR